MKDLTVSHIDRKNVLNNNTAVKEMYDQLGFVGILFEKRYRFTLSQVAKFYDVDTRTIKRLLEDHSNELIISGYELFTGNKLKQFKEVCKAFFIAFKRFISVAFFYSKVVGMVGCL